VAAKLVQKLSFVPLILAGRKAPGHKILIGFDGSEGSWHAVDFVGRTMGGGKFKVKLIHVMRGKADSRPEVQRLYSPAKYTRFTRKEITAEMVSARQKLVELGFKAAQVSTELVGGASSRAGAIAAEARQSGYGIIVMGRRGHSRVRDFFIGRVTNKVIHVARDRTVWIVR
jgi:nucleotide-binding universal stress UspA family protein